MKLDNFQLAGDAARIYETCAALFMAPFVNAAVDAAGISDGASLLDVACGTGFVPRHAASTFQNVRLVGLDVSEPMLNVARAMAPEITWVASPVDELPFEEETFDAVTCQQGFQFFPDAVGAASEMARVLKRGSKAVATVWAGFDRCPYFKAQSEALGRHVNDEAAGFVQKAVAHNDGLLTHAFNEAGFEQVELSLIEAQVELPPVVEYVTAQLDGTPWGQLLRDVGPDAQKGFANYFTEALSEYELPNGSYSIPFGSYMAVGVKP